MRNDQAIGYMLLACKAEGMGRDQVKRLVSEMYYLFDTKTEEEAEEKGYEWYHSKVE
jgi:hypothetical protein